MLIFLSSLFADDEICYNPQFKKNHELYNLGEPVEDHEMMPGYNAEGRIDVKGKMDVNISASYLYWTTMQKGMLYSYLRYTTDDLFTNSRNKVFEIDTNFKSGFKVAIGASSNYDNWQLKTEYTKYSSKTNNTKHPLNGDQNLYSLWNRSAVITKTLTIFLESRLSNGRSIFIKTVL